jgi:hypothetical protein
MLDTINMSIDFVDGRAVLEASELGWRPGFVAPSVSVDGGVFLLSQIDRCPDGSVAGWVFRCGRLSITVVND